MRGGLARVRTFRRPALRGGAASGERKLMNLEMTYSLEILRARKLEHEITCRDVNGYFDHVWSVHPAVGSSPEHSPATAYGMPVTTPITTRHTMIEGKVSQFRWPAILAPVNFAISQSVLVLQLLRLIRSQGVSIVRAGDPYYNGLLGLLLARLTGTPFVVRINSNQDAIYEATGDLAVPRLLRTREIERRVARYVLRRADLVAAASENNLRFGVANGADPARSTVFRYGTWVDPLHFRDPPPDRASISAELGLEGRPWLVLVSRLEPVKHPEDVLHAFAQARRRHPSLALVFVGDGTMRAELESMSGELGVADDVHFVGNRDQIWIASALTSATVVLSPLTGRALVEGCLSGTPVVAYDVEWHSELVSTGETGVLVPYRDTDAMGEAAGDLVADPAAAEVIGEKAREATLEMMDPGRLMEHERSEYEKLLRA